MKHRLLCAAAALVLAAGCSQQPGRGSDSSLTFATPEEAITALAAAAEKNDVDEL